MNLNWKDKLINGTYIHFEKSETVKEGESSRKTSFTFQFTLIVGLSILALILSKAC